MMVASDIKKRLLNAKACRDSFAAVVSYFLHRFVVVVANLIVLQPTYQSQTAEETARVWERSLLLELRYSMDAARKTLRQAFPLKIEKW
jgi:hypothetical protein